MSDQEVPAPIPVADQAAVAPDPGATAAATAADVARLQAAIVALTERVTALEGKVGTAHGPVAAPVVALASLPVAQSARTDGISEIKSLIESLFVVALAAPAGDAEAMEAQFDAFKTLVHHDRQGSPLLDGDLRRYKFAPFVGRARDYLADASKPGSFQLERVLPDLIEARTESVKVHVTVRGGRRMSPPITFRRDAHCGGAFRIENSSL